MVAPIVNAICPIGDLATDLIALPILLKTFLKYEGTPLTLTSCPAPPINLKIPASCGLMYAKNSPLGALLCNMSLAMFMFVIPPSAIIIGSCIPSS